MERNLEVLARDVERLEQITQGWAENQQSTVHALRNTLEEIQAGAFRRLIRTIKEQPGGLEALKEAVEDEWVFGVLSYHGLLRAPEPSVEDQIEAALEKVRPTLARHSGDVELVAFIPPHEVQLRMLGSCDGCALSTITIKLGVEEAIKEAIPSIEKITIVQGKSQGTNQDHSQSPFQKPWQDAGAEADVAEGQLITVELNDASVLLTRLDGKIRAYPNACTHLGMPLDTGTYEEGVLTCRYHGFQYLLKTGECLTTPDIQLPPYPVRVQGGRIEIQVTL